MCFFFSKVETWSFTNLHTDPNLARNTKFFFLFTTYRAAKLEHWLDCCRPRISGWRTSPRRSEFQNQVNALSQTTEYLKQVLSNYCQRQNVNALWHICGLTEQQKRATDIIWLIIVRRLTNVSYNSIVLLYSML